MLLECMTGLRFGVVSIETVERREDCALSSSKILQRQLKASPEIVQRFFGDNSTLLRRLYNAS